MEGLTYLALCAFFTLTLGENCDKYGIRLYEDMACKPVKYNTLCPTSYNCKLQAPNQCIVREKIYDISDPIPRNIEDHSCEFGCFCNLPKVTCPQWGCANWAGVPPVPTECHRKYSLQSCCSTGILCPPFNDTTTCTVNGRVYKSGEKFFPKNTCYACVCQKGFEGKYEKPFCAKIGCDAQVKNQAEIQKNCAPVYTKQENDGEAKCCPSLWTCPDGTEAIKTSNEELKLTCHFGTKTLKVGDSFEKEISLNLIQKKRVKCECKIPPLLICQEL